MKRVPEPQELMDEAEQARAYAEADFSEANERFLDLLDDLHPAPIEGRVLDLGCGPADIPVRLARRHPGIALLAVDGAPAMLALARKAVAGAGLAQRIALRQAHLPDPTLPQHAFDLVLSNSLLHHLADPLDLWRTIRHCARPGALFLVMDLCRPASATQLNELVARYAADAPAVLRRDFHASLRAAYRPEEVEQQLDAAGLAPAIARRISDRHLVVVGHA